MRADLIPALLVLAIGGVAWAEPKPMIASVRAAPLLALACPVSIPMQKVHALPEPWVGGTIGQELTSASIRKRLGKDVLECGYNTGYVAATMTVANACAVAPDRKGFRCAQGTQFSAPN